MEGGGTQNRPSTSIGQVGFEFWWCLSRFSRWRESPDPANIAGICKNSLHLHRKSLRSHDHHWIWMKNLRSPPDLGENRKIYTESRWRTQDLHQIWAYKGRSPLKLGWSEREKEKNQTNLPILWSGWLRQVERSETETRTDEGRVSLDKTIIDHGGAWVGQLSVWVAVGPKHPYLHQSYQLHWWGNDPWIVTPQLIALSTTFGRVLMGKISLGTPGGIQMED